MSLKLPKKNAFYPNRISFRRHSLDIYIESDKKIKKFDDMGTLTGQEGLTCRTWTRTLPICNLFFRTLTKNNNCDF